MKIDPETGLEYDHSPSEWIQVLKKHGPGLSLVGSAAQHLRPKSDESASDPGAPSKDQEPRA
jgi:hypothetical protein